CGPRAAAGWIGRQARAKRDLENGDVDSDELAAAGSQRADADDSSVMKAGYALAFFAGFTDAARAAPATGRSRRASPARWDGPRRARSTARSSRRCECRRPAPGRDGARARRLARAADGDAGA